jgi:peptidoglycan lytic transglycosylase
MARRGGALRTVAFLLLVGIPACRSAGLPVPTTGPGTGGSVRVALSSATSRAAAVGRASWYGEFHHGQLTASGETFDMMQLTAAHRTLPLGTRLRVTNLENGRMVRVRVNDRGPYVDGRILDLSLEAARALDMVERGVVPVRLDIIATH